MSGIFSFIKHPMIHLLETSGSLLPGIEKAVSVFYHAPSDELQGKVLHNPTQNNTIEDLYLSDLNLINKVRTENKSITWQLASNLPFETAQIKKVQLNIFDELNFVVLCLAFKNEADQKNDLLYLYLNHNKGNFGVASSDVPLSTDEKGIIGKLVYNALNSIYEQHKTDSAILSQTNRRVKALQDENSELKAEINQLKASYNHAKVNDYSAMLAKIAVDYQVHVSLDKSATDKLIAFNGGYETIEQILRNSAMNAINTKFGISSEDLVLNEWDLIFNIEPTVSSKPEFEVVERYKKTFQLLEKLEDAAKDVLQRNQKLTSGNVGNACPIPISAPAISDALKNHHKKVLSLMNEYPERWPIIKNEFRPIKNILLGNTG